MPCLHTPDVMQLLGHRNAGSTLPRLIRGFPCIDPSWESDRKEGLLQEPVTCDRTAFASRAGGITRWWADEPIESNVLEFQDFEIGPEACALIDGTERGYGVVGPSLALFQISR